MSKVGKQIIAGLEEAVTMTEIMELFKGTKLDRLRAIAKAERDGRVVVLPCKMQELKDAINEISYSEGCLLDVHLSKYGNCKMDCFECLTSAIAEAAAAGKG